MILQEITEKFGRCSEIQVIHSVHGGCIGRSYKVKIGNSVYFLKTSDDPKAKDIFRAEADGLFALRERGLERVPEVIATGNNYLLVPWIEAGEKTKKGMQKAGEALALLHVKAYPYYGFERNNYIGSLPQPNSKSFNWPQFYFQHRLWYMAQIAQQRKGITVQTLNQVEMLQSRLEDLIPNEPPSLLHGDLWGANLMIDTQGNPWFIDPAIYAGHREVDLAMTMLFGGFDSSFYEAYQSTYALLPDFKERIALYQLYPLLVHAALFGSGYHRQVVNCLRVYL
ncbi:MAG: fructosamine kinase family protein [Chitinophagales bacterium]|nr:fructosamine kinase family protein [Chitinophagales bacterium]MDW8272719.1 fructosamine kinase family protein [Chitinophagales bacterium]